MSKQKIELQMALTWPPMPRLLYYVVEWIIRVPVPDRDLIPLFKLKKIKGFAVSHQRLKKMARNGLGP